MHDNDRRLPCDFQEAIGELVELATNEVGSFSDFETKCRTTLAKAGRALMKQALDRLSPANAFEEGNRRWSVAVESHLPVMTTFGKVAVKRRLFRSERNGPTRCLVEERANLVAGFWTPDAAKLAAIAVAEMPLARAESFFAEAGVVTASRSSLLRLTHQLSELWEIDRERHEQEVRSSMPIPADAATVAFSLDGVMVMMTASQKAAKKAAARHEGQIDKGPAGWREASVGVVSFYDAAGKRLATRRYGRMPEKNKVATKAWLDAEMQAIRRLRPDLTTVAIADGAANNWSFLESLEVVDFFHTAEHLHQHVSKANGASTLETQAKLKKMRYELLEVSGGATKVFTELQAMRYAAGTEAVSTTKTEGKRQPTFFQRHHKRMDYHRYREANLPIGTGVTESTCKLTVCDRLRRTGMRWSEAGGQAVITLRAHRVSESFDPAWNVLLKANQSRLAA